MLRPPPLIAALLLLAGCSYFDAGEQNDLANLQRLEAQIVEAVGEARAASVDECQALAFGAKACGGPSRTLVYSEADGDPERVRVLAEQYTRLEDAINRRYGRASDCAFLMTPTPALEGGRCVAGPPAEHP